jgi:hypothetical protein
MAHATPWQRVVLAAAMSAVVALAVVEVAANREARGRLDDPSPPDAPAWTDPLDRMNAALAHRDMPTALRAWRDAYAAAFASRRWEGMLDVGHAYLRIGDAAHARAAFVPKARQAYLSALFRARQGGSPDGVLRVAAAFETLGDREMVQQCVVIAESMAGSRRERRWRARMMPSDAPWPSASPGPGMPASEP